MHAKDGKVPSYRVKEAYFCAVKVEECAKYNISDYLLLFFLQELTDIHRVQWIETADPSFYLSAVLRLSI